MSNIAPEEQARERDRDRDAAAIHVGRSSRRWRIPHPRTADGASSWLAIIVGIGIPVWIWISIQTGDVYVPTKPNVWDDPWAFAMAYFLIQIFFLLISSGRSDQIGMGDTLISGLAFCFVLGTTVVVGVLAAQGSYHLNDFQLTLIIAALTATFFEFLYTGWMRFLVNRRYFAAAPGVGGGGDGHHHGG
jgi:hypothetical protein